MGTGRSGWIFEIVTIDQAFISRMKAEVTVSIKIQVCCNLELYQRIGIALQIVEKPSYLILDTALTLLPYFLVL